MFAESLLNGQVTKFSPNNGGWGVNTFHCFPLLPIARESDRSHSIYTLGQPEVVWWEGSEYGRVGYGIAIYVGDKFDKEAVAKQFIKVEEGWAIFYTSDNCLRLTPEKLSAIGVAAFEVKVSRSGLEITQLQAEKSGDPRLLSVGTGRMLKEEEVNALRILAQLNLLT